MASITLKNVPEDLRLQMKARAAKHGRSLNQEIMQCLRVAVTAEAPGLEQELALLREHHRQQRAAGIFVRPETVEELIEAGRQR